MTRNTSVLGNFFRYIDVITRNSSVSLVFKLVYLLVWYSDDDAGNDNTHFHIVVNVIKSGNSP